MKKLNFPGGKSVRLSRVCVSGSVQAAVKERRRGHRRAPSGQPAVAPVSSRAAQLDSASRFSLFLTCALSSVHFSSLSSSGVTAPAVLLPAAPANI